MTQSSGPFSTGAGATFSETQWRELFANLVSPGVLKGAVVDGGASPASDMVASLGGGLVVNIGTGCAVVKGFAYKNDAVVGFTVANRDSSIDRFDRVVLRLDFTGKTVQLVKLQGTPAVVAPTLTSTTWDVLLVQIHVTHNATATLALTSGELIDERQYAGSLPPAAQGSGSGLNADTLDGITSSAFVLGNAASQHIIVLNRAPTNSDGVDGDLLFQW